MRVEATVHRGTILGARSLLIPPTRSGSAAAVESARIAAAGLAGGWEAQVGPVDVLFDRRIVPGGQLTATAIRDGSKPRRSASVVSALPSSVRPAIGDVRAAVRGRKRAEMLPLGSRGGYLCVIQYHHRFQRAGMRASHELGAPLLLRVEALEVREERQWGVRRPGYGRIVEATGELPLFRAADLLLPVSRQVDEQLSEAGLESARRYVLPNGVDVDAFSPGDPDPRLIDLPQARNRFVVGWIGGFRPFHGLKMIPEIAAQLSTRVPEAVLCLVGSGPLWRSMAARTRLARNVVMVPAVAYSQVPHWLRTFDACLLLAPPGSFHYSPLKLREYMACGRPIVAPSIGEVPSVVSDGKEALLVPPGDVQAVVRAVERLARDRELRARLGKGARIAATRNESWDVRARSLFEAMADHGLVNVPGMS
jgi:glycosyltransferase involved in cell wall biosynthesis